MRRNRPGRGGRFGGTVKGVTLVHAWMRREGESAMDYQEFVRTVRSRGGFELQERAARVIASTFETLGEIISSPDRRRLVRQLPAELQEQFVRQPPVPPYPLDEFLTRVAAREGTTFEDAERDVRLVVSVLRDTVGGEIEELWTRLPGEYRRLLNPGTPPAPQL